MNNSIEIILDLPFPPSGSAIWRYVGRGRVIKSPKYKSWIKDADATVMLLHEYPKHKITGPFEIVVLLNDEIRKRGDGDNYGQKAILDYCQSRELIRNDVDCRRGSWEWVEASLAPRGCRITLRNLHHHD